jgi:serine/threonine protein kinase
MLWRLEHYNIYFFNILEEVKEFAGKPLDIWALGVLTFLLTYRDLPFKPENPDNIIDLLNLIMKAE